MQVSISSWSYRTWFQEGKCDLMSFLDEVKRQGADGLEIFPRHVNRDDPGGHLKQAAGAAEKLGLSIATVIAGNDFARVLAAERAEQVQRMKEWIVQAAKAGIHRLNTFTGYHTPGEDPFVEAVRVIDSYREVMPVAEEHNVLLCIENHSTVCRDADSILAIIRAVGSDNRSGGASSSWYTFPCPLGETFKNGFSANRRSSTYSRAPFNERSAS